MSLDRPGGGLFVVGSHVLKTTRQVGRFWCKTDIRGIEIEVATLLADDRQSQEIGRVMQRVETALPGGSG